MDLYKSFGSDVGGLWEHAEICVARANRTPPKSITKTALPDRVAFYQKDRRWAHEQLGHSDGTLGADGCLVTATSMALVNLGL